MRSLLVRFLVGLLLAVAVSHAVVLVRLADRFDEDRAESVLPFVEEAAGRMSGTLDGLPAPERSRALPRIALREGVEARLHPRGEPPLGVGQAPWQRLLGVRHPLATRQLSDGSTLVVRPRSGPPPVGPGEVLLQGVVVLGSVGLVAWLLARPLARDLSALEAGVGALGGEALSTRVPVPKTGPVRTLATALNGMADRIERLVIGQRTLVQAVSHELRTPHARLRFRLDALAATVDAGDRERLRGEIERDLDEVDDLLDELLAYLRVDAEPVPADSTAWRLVDAIDAVVDRIHPLRPDRLIDVDVPDATLRVGQRWFERAVANLLTNALRHAHTQLHIRGRVDGDTLVLDVDDDGPGIPPEARARALEPFVTGDASRTRGTGGIGLGLAIVRRVLERSGGTITLGEASLGGLRATTRWPLR